MELPKLINNTTRNPKTYNLDNLDNLDDNKKKDNTHRSIQMRFSNIKKKYDICWNIE